MAKQRNSRWRPLLFALGITAWGALLLALSFILLPSTLTLGSLLAALVGGVIMLFISYRSYRRMKRLM